MCVPTSSRARELLVGRGRHKAHGHGPGSVLCSPSTWGASPLLGKMGRGRWDPTRGFSASGCPVVLSHAAVGSCAPALGPETVFQARLNCTKCSTCKICSVRK